MAGRTATCVTWWHPFSRCADSPSDVLLTSHGGMLTTDIGAAWDHALQRLLEREKRVAARLEKGLTPEAIVAEGIFFPTKSQVPEPMRSFLYMWDTAMFDHHRS